MPALATSPMPKPTEYCTYRNVRIDDQVLPMVTAMAALSGKTVQDYLSDVMNKAAADGLGRPPIRRRPTPPKPKSPGRPRKKPPKD